MTFPYEPPRPRVRRHRVRHVGVRTVLPARCPGCGDVIREKGELRGHLFAPEDGKTAEAIVLEHKGRGCTFRAVDLKQTHVQEVLLV
jgi:hypothetical protein